MCGMQPFDADNDPCKSDHTTQAMGWSAINLWIFIITRPKSWRFGSMLMFVLNIHAGASGTYGFAEKYLT